MTGGPLLAALWPWAARAQSAACPMNAPSVLVDAVNGKIYRLYDGPATYEAAVSKCSLLEAGSHPVVYNNAKEQVRCWMLSVEDARHWRGPAWRAEPAGWPAQRPHAALSKARAALGKFGSRVACARCLPVVMQSSMLRHVRLRCCRRWWSPTSRRL